MNLYIYQMTTGPMAQPPAEPMTFQIRADSKEAADIRAVVEAAKLRGKFVFVKSI